MSREMTVGTHVDSALALSRELDPYARALRDLQPSPTLDGRINAAIESWGGHAGSKRWWTRPIVWVATAASLAVISGGIALLAMRGGGRASTAEGLSVAASQLPGLQIERMGVPALAAGQVSQWPAEAAIFRVKASFVPTSGFVPPGAQDGERQYWVDVRIANDGTMRIMQVLPAGTHGRDSDVR